jgi:hypothetical protein
VPSFSDTAEYFESRAKRERSEERRKHFLETAEFYRALAQITPTFPPGYEPPTLAKLADRMSRRAEQCRAIAATMQDPECKAKLLRLADAYEQASRSGE